MPSPQDTSLPDAAERLRSAAEAAAALLEGDLAATGCIADVQHCLFRLRIAIYQAERLLADTIAHAQTAKAST
jgi:hypothetical protein